MAFMMSMTTGGKMNTQRESIMKAVTEYDKKQLHKHLKNERFYYNPCALSLYHDAVDRTCEAIQQGQDTRSALVDNFCGRLLDIVLKSVGEPKSTDAEQRINGKLGF